MTDHEQDPDQWPDDFPAEIDLQGLRSEDISPDFVDRTWDRVRAELSDRFPLPDEAEQELDNPDPDSIELPAEVLAAYTTPEPSADFVQQTMARMQRDASPQWQSLLAKYSVPRPSADFVDRVLSALRGGSSEAPARVVPLRRASRRSIWLAAAAAVLITVGVIALRQPQDQSLPFEVLSAESFSPSPWGSALSARFEGGLAVERDDPTLHLAALVGVGKRD